MGISTHSQYLAGKHGQRLLLQSYCSSGGGRVYASAQAGERCVSNAAGGREHWEAGEGLVRNMAGGEHREDSRRRCTTRVLGGRDAANLADKGGKQPTVNGTSSTTDRLTRPNTKVRSTLRYRRVRACL